MEDTLQKDLKKQYDSLPPEVQKAILSADLSGKLQEITKNNKLLIDQAGKLETETYLVLLGLEALDDYLDNLVKNVGLPKEKALLVVHDVNELVFKSVRESLKKINLEAVQAENARIAPDAPTKEEILSGIETPNKIKEKEESISVSSLASNKPAVESVADLSYQGIEIRKENLPQIEIQKEAVLPVKTLRAPENIPLHQNISPVENIVQAKMTGEVIVPRQNVIIEDKTKLPEKNEPKHVDSYREPII